MRTQAHGPWILGHENAGWVDALGPGVRGLEIGQPVAVYGGWGCGVCRVCLRGEEQLCDPARWVGFGSRGGYAQYLIVPSARHLVKIDGLDPVEVAPLTDAGVTSYRAVKKARPFITPGTTALLIGVGGLGQLALQLLRALTPAKVVALEPSDERRALAADLGADLVLDPLARSTRNDLWHFAGPGGIAAVLDLVGTNQTMALALEVVSRQGIVVLVGLSGGIVPLSFHGMAAEAMVTTSHWGSREDLIEVLALVRTEALTTRVERHSLASINEVFTLLAAGKINGRAVLTP
jgi:propanol-preferring alcohol dehydrogenase